MFLHGTFHHQTTVSLLQLITEKCFMGQEIGKLLFFLLIPFTSHQKIYTSWKSYCDCLQQLHIHQKSCCKNVSSGLYSITLSSLEIQTYAMNTGKANSKHAHCYTYYNLVPSSLDYSRIKIIAILKRFQKGLESTILNLNHFCEKVHVSFCEFHLKAEKNGHYPPLEYSSSLKPSHLFFWSFGDL